MGITMIIPLFFALTASLLHANGTIPLDSLRPVERVSGKINYYALQKENGETFLRAHYRPGLSTVLLGWEASAAAQKASQLRWKWRALTYPLGADERVEGKGDSPAALYCFFSKGMRSYTLKYVFSSTVPENTRFADNGPNPFHRQWLIVLRTKGPESQPQWHSQTIDFRQDFQKCFGIQAPPLKGFGLMSDGDGTASEVIADYGDLQWYP